MNSKNDFEKLLKEKLSIRPSKELDLKILNQFETDTQNAQKIKRKNFLQRLPNWKWSLLPLSCVLVIGFFFQKTELPSNSQQLSLSEELFYLDDNFEDFVNLFDETTPPSSLDSSAEDIFFDEDFESFLDLVHHSTIDLRNV